MDNKKNYEYFKPIHYADGDEFKYPILPFIVAHMTNLQDTLILTPQFIANRHDEFINKLYSNLDNIKLENPAFKSFFYHDYICLSVIFPTNLTDEGGRKGLYVSFGILAKCTMTEDYISLILNYLNSYLKVVNRVFSLSLPKNGASEFLMGVHSTNTWEVSNDKIQVVLDTMLLSSIAIEAVMNRKRLVKLIPYTSKALRMIKYSLSKMYFWIFRCKIPKAIYYPKEASSNDLFNMYFREVGCNLHWLGKIGIQQSSENGIINTDIISILPTDLDISSYKKAKLKNINGKRYLKMY